MSKHIQQELIPAQDEDDEESCATFATALTLGVVEKSVKSIADRINYGLDAIHAPNGRVSPSWQVWRWEVRQEFRSWLPKTVQDKVVVRLKERQQVRLYFKYSDIAERHLLVLSQAKEDVETLFLSLSEAQRTAVVGNKSVGAIKPPNGPKDVKKLPDVSACNSTPMAVTSDNIPPTSSPTKVPDTDAAEENQGNESSTRKSAGRPKKPVDPEKAAKVLNHVYLSSM